MTIDQHFMQPNRVNCWASCLITFPAVCRTLWALWMTYVIWMGSIIIIYVLNCVNSMSSATTDTSFKHTVTALKWCIVKYFWNEKAKLTTNCPFVSMKIALWHYQGKSTLNNKSYNKIKTWKIGRSSGFRRSMLL